MCCFFVMPIFQSIAMLIELSKSIAFAQILNTTVFWKSLLISKRNREKESIFKFFTGTWLTISIAFGQNWKITVFLKLMLTSKRNRQKKVKLKIFLDTWLTYWARPATGGKTVSCSGQRLLPCTDLDKACEKQHCF